MSSKQVQLSSLSPAEIKKLALDLVQTLLLTVNLNTLSYRQLQAFVMYLRLNKWIRPDFKANQKKAILLAEVTSQVAAAQRQAKPKKAKPTKNKSKSKPKCNAVPFNVDRLVSDKKDEIAKVEKITGYTAYIINSKQYKREVVRFDTKRKVEQSDGSDVNQPVTAITAYYVKGKGWRDAISPRKSTVTYYDTLEMLVTSCGDYRNKINDSVESFRNNIYQRIDIIKQLDHLYSMT